MNLINGLTFYAIVSGPLNPAKLFKLSPIKSLQVKQFGLYFGQFEHLERLPLAESINLIGLITFSANRLYYFHWICRWQSLGYKAYRFPIINSIFPSDYRKYCLPYQYCQWICRPKRRYIWYQSAIQDSRNFQFKRFWWLDLSSASGCLLITKINLS